MQSYQKNLIEGDILFSYLVGSEETSAIASLCYGWNNTKINHVGIYIGNYKVIEAIGEGVKITSLSEYFDKSINLLCGRIKNKIQAKSACEKAKELVGKPYNFSYVDNNDSYYCSQLVFECYKSSNKNKDFFKKSKLKFRSPETNEIIPFFIEYYKKLDIEIPENELGTHPATMSLDDKLKITVIK